MVKIMTTNEVSEYLKLHEITICKYAAEGQIPAFRIGRICQFDKDVIDDWIRTGQNETRLMEDPKGKAAKKESGMKKPRKGKG